MTTPLLNSHGQPIGATLHAWTPPPVPPREVMTGRFCELRPLDIAAAHALYDVFSIDPDDREWTYLPYGPFAGPDEFRQWMASSVASPDYVLFSVHSGHGRRPTGIAAYLRIMPASRSVEVGHLRLNEPSRRAAARLGFTFEGIFRQAAVYKGRTRDTAWFSVIDGEWPVLRQAFEAWLDPSNFDEEGRQKQRLGNIRAVPPV